MFEQTTRSRIRGDRPIASTRQKPLRVAILLRSTRVPAWVADLAYVLSNADDFEPTAFVISDLSRVQPAGTRQATLFQRTRTARRRSPTGSTISARDPFAAVDLQRIVPSVPLLVMRSGVRAPSETPFDVAVAADYSLAAEHMRWGLRLRLGAWFSHELALPSSSARPGVWCQLAEAQRQEQVTVTVTSLDGEPPVERVISAADISLESPLPSKRRACVGWSAVSLLLAALEHACHQEEWTGAGQLAAPSVLTTRLNRYATRDRTLRASHHAALLSCVGRLGGAAVKRASLKRQWLLAYQFGGNSDLSPSSRIRLLVPPPDRFWADPHVVFANDEYHVFFEEFNYIHGKGHISTMRLGESGPLGTSLVAFSCEYHLSYPFVFAFDGDWYMIPECSQAGRIDVFRAEDFPVRWAYAATLIRNVRAVDTTLVEHGGRWWLFTTIRRLRGDPPLSHLYLFSAASPLSEVWEPHPMNPIVSGEAGARAAGGIMTRGDRLLRPSQDCGGSYGRRILLSEIVAMDGRKYLERPAGSLETNEASGFIGLHTVSQAGDLTVVDLCRWISRG